MQLILSPCCACTHKKIRIGELFNHKVARNAIRDFKRLREMARKAALDHSRPIEEHYFSVHWRGRHILGLK